MPAQPAPAPAPPADATAQVDLDALRLRPHARAAPLASVASLVVAALLLWQAHSAIPLPRLLAWLLLLAGAVCWRLWLPLAQRRALQRPAGVPDGPMVPQNRTRWLRRYRGAMLAHGLVWGLAAWLPASLADSQLQASVIIVLAGLAVGAATLTLFDLVAAMLFAGPVLGLLALRLASLDGPLPPARLVACVMAALLLAMLGLAGRRGERDRLALAIIRRAERQSAQGARDAQALLQQVFDHAGLGISVFDPGQRLLAWNSNLAAHTGLDPALLRPGMPLADALRQLAASGQFGPVRDVEAEVARRLRLLCEPVPGVSRERLPDRRLIEVRRNPLPGGGLVMFHADITEREARRRAAAEQQRMLALVLARTEQGFWYVDNDLRTTDANPAMCRMLGLERAQLLGRSICEFVDPANRAIFAHQAALRASGQAGSYEIALRHADGHLVHCFNNATPVLDAAGRKTGALGLFSDISAQKAAELQIRQAGEALTQKSNVLAWTLDSLVQGVLNVDPQGRCIAWNRRFVELLQLPPGLMDGQPMLSDVLAWQLAQGAFGARQALVDAEGQASIARAQAGAPSRSGHRYRRTRPDGTVLDVASHFAADGSLVRTFTDVTASVAAEAALIAARDEAESANRAKSDFLSRMSHELRTPLHAILGFAQLLQADRDDPPSAGQRQRLDALVRGGQHLLALINDVLDVARIEAGNLQLQLEPVDLRQLVQEALALVQPMAQARAVQLEPLPAAAPGTSLVTADATRLRQVLLNLLSNAIKFNRDGGTVRLCLHQAGPHLRLEVADQGKGIAPAQLPRLFQAFERLDMDGAVEGTGIGLALSRSLVMLMHGEIGVHSTPGHGSLFWLQLPASQAPVPAHGGSPAPAPPAAPLPGGRHDVLYIEDNEVNQLLMQGMLAHRPDIDLRLAGLPETGLAMALAQPPDLVLLDIQLPGIDGFEVLRRLRQQPALQQVPVVAVSANAMPADLALAQEAGFNGYLTKPLDMQQLLAAVDAALSR